MSTSTASPEVAEGDIDAGAITAVVREPVEVRCAAELAVLAAHDRWARPAGWRLSPRMVEAFVLGAEALAGPDGKMVPIPPKFVGERRLVQVAIATLAADRALLLTGEPGTAKSHVSEHLAAAISGSSGLTIQGTAGTTEEQIKYGWNYALLIAEGPSRRALVEGPLLRGMRAGTTVRFEELTRCVPEVQDALVSVLSEQQVVIPELGETVGARRGFALIATANTRDRGVNDMSAALKRRFNFVTIPPIGDPEAEAAVVERRVAELLAGHGLGPRVAPPRDLVLLLTTVFAELRRGQTLDGQTRLKSPSTALSTAELIASVTSGAVLAAHFAGGPPTTRDCLAALLGAVAKEQAADLRVLREYLETAVRPREGRRWRELYEAGAELLPT